jgi:cytochrome c553
LLLLDDMTSGDPTLPEVPSLRAGRPARGGRRAAFALLLAPGYLAGCGGATESAPPDLPAKAIEVRDRMHERFTATRRLELSIAFGQLEAAHAEAATIAAVDEPGVLPAWRPYVDQIRAGAREIEQTTNLAAAARTSALLGRRCAQCHEASSAKLTFAKEAPPPTGPKLPNKMASHQWAASRLWEGLVGPSPERWQEGARAMAGAPLTIVAEGDNVPPDLAVSDDVGRIRLFATRALAARTPDERATLYGDLLSTCVRCHAKIRDR